MDIHDQFLSDLNIFKRTLNQKINNVKSTPLSNSDINEINSTLDDLAFTLRGIIDDLHPQAIDMFGLEAALQSYLSRKLSSVEHPDYFINIDHLAENQLSIFQKLSLYRIILESIQNIIRHAHCSRYEIDLRIADDFLVLTIDDNGIGMKMNEHTHKRGHGIFNITQRSYSINAEVQWNSSRFSSGTQVLLKLPKKFLNNEKMSSVNLKASSHVQTV
jgi:signal transduction histidine kinase